MRRFIGVVLTLVAGQALAQASPYVPLDHPLLPLAEHLIARGDLPDPSPLIRPFRRSDLVRLLDSVAAARGDGAPAELQTLRDAFRDRDESDWFRVAPRAGLQSFTRARRDLLHPAGDGGTRFYADAMIEARVGDLVLVSRPIAENRLKEDPDWDGGALQRTKRQAYCFADAYLSAQLGRVRLFYGQMDRNWGPVGTPGIGLSSYGYPRTALGFELRLRDIQLDALGTELTPMIGPAGEEHQRFFVAHRLNVRLSRTVSIAAWETAVLAGPGQTFEPYFRNPLVLLAFPIQFGRPDDYNTLVGGDVRWRPGRFKLAVQAAIDDKWRLEDDPDGTGEIAHPGRWAFTVTAAGPLGRRASWRASTAVVNALAFRTADSTRSLLDRGVGIGPHHTDNLLVTLSASVPAAGRWLVTPDVALLWQGEGRIDAPFPAGAALSATPELFIGTVARTTRLGLSVAGSTGRLAVTASGGLHHTANADHVRGRSRTRLEGRIQATVGISIGGALR